MDSSKKEMIELNNVFFAFWNLSLSKNVNENGGGVGPQNRVKKKKKRHEPSRMAVGISYELKHV